MTALEWRVPVGAEAVSAVFEPGTANGADSAAVFVCAHGAGGNIADRGTLASARAMQNHGIGVVRFNFLYRENKRGSPDKMPKLVDTFAAVVARAREELSSKTLIIGGRSMGGRAASMMASEGFDADGLLLLAYPLHPPGAPEKLRAAHLPTITMPVIQFSGTRDPFCTRALMEAAIATAKTSWEMHWVETADHSFHVLKSSGKTDAQVMDDIGAAAAAWSGQSADPSLRSGTRSAKLSS